MDVKSGEVIFDARKRLPAAANVFDLADYLDAAHDHYKFAVNRAVVDHEFNTPDGAVHLAAAGIKPIKDQQVVPSQGCVPLQLLPAGCMVTSNLEPVPDAQAEQLGSSSGWGEQQVEQQQVMYQTSVDSRCADSRSQPGPLHIELERSSFGQVLHVLSRSCLLSQPRLLAAFNLYQLCFANVSGLKLVDTDMGELQRPVQLGAFLALQRLHLENMAELLQTEWAIKVGGKTVQSL